MKTIRVAAAVIRSVNEKQEPVVFATQRGYGEYKDWWEFPGGKIEDNETPEEALVREIREELDAVIRVDGFLTTVEYEYPSFHLSMDCFWCSLQDSHMTLLEHEAARWLLPEELHRVNWLPADLLVVNQIEIDRSTCIDAEKKRLKEPAFRFYTHNEIRPEGWLRRQLRIQADGLAGNLDRVWPDVRESKWIGGEREGWERAPYWLDGFIPLAYLLEDEEMIARAKAYIDGILLRQKEDGWICPCEEQERRVFDIWPAFLIGKVLVLYADLSGDERIPDAVYRMMHNLYEYTMGATLHNWAMYRWFEALIPLYWLYERRPEEWMLRFAQRLSEQGYDYNGHFAHYMDREPVREWSYSTHVVNLAMALKQDALMCRLYGGDPDAFAANMLDRLLTDHGMAMGHFTGDECLAGDSPIQGTELCGVVEAMYSYEQLLSVSGNPKWADCLERLAFNALPATVSDDMWTHQYDQQTNQVACVRQPDGQVVFGTNGPDSNLFGLEPNYGCCTANMGQGFPKLAMIAFLHSGREIYSAVPLPSTLRTDVQGVPVTVSLQTEYPFKGDLHYSVETGAEAAFSLRIRIPSWAERVQVCGAASYTISRDSLVIPGPWSGHTEFSVAFQYECVLEERPRGMAALWRGPLLYSVPVRAKKEMHEYIRDGVERKYPYCDYELIPQSDWNYAFCQETAFDVTEHAVPEIPFSSEAPAVTVDVQMQKIDWRYEYGYARMEPESLSPIGESERVSMIPYGAAKLRMTEMPVIGKPESAG